MTNPLNYKQQSALIKSLEKNSHKLMDVKLAWWYKNAEYALIHNFGWEEKQAALFVSRYHPTKTAYIGEGFLSK